MVKSIKTKSAWIQNNKINTILLLPDNLLTDNNDYKALKTAGLCNELTEA